MSRLLISILACAGLAMASVSTAAPPDKGPKGQADQKAKPDQKTDQKAGKAKHQHKNANGKALLGAKLKQDGKHEVGKLKDRTVVAEVKAGKVKNMSAGDLPMKRVKTKTKMAANEGALLQASWSGQFQLAQYEPYYYGYCFDDGYDFQCYWYPEEDVDYQDYDWEDYDPYY
jgi:hypothetical protein